MRHHKHHAHHDKQKHEPAAAPAKSDEASAPAAVAAPDVAPAAPAQRLGGLPPALDVGEQVVGSDHPFILGIPMNQDRSGVAMVTTAIEGDGVFQVESHKLETLGPLMTSQPLTVRFAPKASGPVKATLRLVAVWSDGHSETKEIALTGRARTLDEAPHIAAASPAAVAKMNDEALREATANVQSEAAIVAAKERPEPWPKSNVELEAAASRASKALTHMVGNQVEAVGTVERSAGAYVAPPAATPWWLGLVEVAVSTASAGLAGYVLEKLVAQVGEHAISHQVHTLLDEGFKESTKALIMKAVEHGREGNEANEAPEGRAGADGKGEHEGKEPKREGRNAVSKNATVNFFATQRLALGDSLDVEDSDVIQRALAHLRPLLYTDPTAAVGAMTAIADGFHLAEPKATELQRKSTGAAWVAFKARAHLGEQKIHHAGSNEDVAVSNIENANDLDADDPTGVGAKAGRGLVGALGGLGPLGTALPLNLPQRKTVDGVLEIDVQASQKQVAVVSARLNGISFDIADDLLETDLKAANLPVKIVVNGRDAEVLRDEEGRVFVHGDARGFADDAVPFDTEIGGAAVAEQAELAGERLVDRVFAKPLSAWGLKKIETNDVGGKI